MMSDRIGGGAIALGVGVGLIWLGLAGAGLSAAAGARAGQTLLAPSDSTDGVRLLRQGERAQSSDDLARADALYRASWESPSTRDRAAEALRRLHNLPGFSPPVDEAQVEEAIEQLGPGFSRMETARFVVLSNADQRWTAARAALLERTHHQLFRVMDRMRYPIAPAAKKLLVIFFRDHADYREFAKRVDGVEAGWIAGYYSGMANRAVFYDDTTGPAFAAAFETLSEQERRAMEARREATRRRREDRDAAAALAARADDMATHVAHERERLAQEAHRSSEAKTIHEATHLLAFNCGVQSRAREHPFWLTEGLASSFETSRPHAAFGPDQETDFREEAFERFAREGALLPMKEFVSLVGVPEDAPPERADVMYAQAHALFEFLHRHERRALSAFIADFWDRPPGASSPEERLAMFEERFGEVERFERRWLRLTGARRAMLAD